MTTKLVYVLTCASDKHYIEQALMAVYSARHWNPDAHIVLVVDDNTDKLLVGKRADVLKFVSEKKVVAFEDGTTTPMYRSRWLKTRVRDLVEGDFLFVDCDTICQSSLDDTDSFLYQLAMVPDEHLPICDYNVELKSYLQKNAEILEYDVLNERIYYNSGVIFARDTEVVRDFWRCWHEEWLKGESKGVQIDQSALGKANLMCGHIIDTMPNEWNTLVYMNPLFIQKGKILHFWGFKNKSYIICEPFLEYVQKNGINKYVEKCILNSSETVLPFDNVLYVSTFKERLKMVKSIRNNLRDYFNEINSSFCGNPWWNKFTRTEKFIIGCKMYYFASLCYILRCCLFLHKKNNRTKEVYYS